MWGSTGKWNKPTPNETSVDVPLVGNTYLVDILADDVLCKGLLDSGSQVTTVAEWFYKQYLQESDMIAVNELLDLKQVSGQHLDYIGIIAVDLKFPDLDENRLFSTPVIIMNDTHFNHNVPFLVGTNVIKSCLTHLQEEVGPNFIQKAKLCTPWKLAFQCVLSDNKRSFDRKGHVYSTKPVVIPSFSHVTVSGLTRVSSSRETQVVTEPDHLHSLPVGLVLLPSVRQINSSTRYSHRIPVHIRNLTSQQVIIPAKAVICQLQEAVLTDTVESTESEHLDSSFLQQFNFKSEFSSSETEQIKQLLLKWKHLFSTSDTDIGRTDKVKHHIVLTNSEPFKERYRRIPPQLYQEVKQHLRDMLKAKVIRESNSPFASPIVLVRKPDGSLRFCIDFRKLNSRTVKDSYPLPRIDDTLDSLIGARYFSSLDLKAGYWQIELAEEDKAKTAFTVGPLGFYEWETLPFDLVNAPATFQRLMQQTMADIHLKECLLYLDDIIVFSKTFDEHLKRLNSVFERLDEAGLKLKPSKCNFLQDEVKYLGHLVSKDGIRTDPSKIEALQKWPVPTSTQDVCRFIGFAGFYRRFIPDFSKVAKPLHDLLKGVSSKRCKRKSLSQRKSPTNSSVPFRWTGEHEAFQKLINLLSSTPVLAFADFNLPFILHTDASGSGISGVLYQEQEGQKRPIAFASRSLSAAESRYPAHKLEFLALKWAVTDKFKEYLYGSKFTA